MMLFNEHFINFKFLMFIIIDIKLFCFLFFFLVDVSVDGGLSFELIYLAQSDEFSKPSKAGVILNHDG